MKTAREVAHEIIESLTLLVRCNRWGGEGHEHWCDKITAALEARDAEWIKSISDNDADWEANQFGLIKQRNEALARASTAEAEAGRAKDLVRKLVNIATNWCRHSAHCECNACETVWQGRTFLAGTLATPSPTTEGGRGTEPAPKTCEAWCGSEVEPAPNVHTWLRNGRWYCTGECFDGQRPLHPATCGTCGGRGAVGKVCEPCGGRGLYGSRGTSTGCGFCGCTGRLLPSGADTYPCPACHPAPTGTEPVLRECSMCGEGELFLSTLCRSTTDGRHRLVAPPSPREPT